jgi:hypothetical protein
VADEIRDDSLGRRLFVASNNVDAATNLDAMTALTAAIVAALAIIIALALWRAAHQRTVLGLFEARMATYSELREAVGKVVRLGSVSNQNLYEFLKAADKVQFLFGREVKAYTDELYQHLLNHQFAETTIKRAEGNELNRAIAEKHNSILAISAFYQDFPRLLAPYARMDHKLPFWWITSLADKLGGWRPKGRRK